MVNSVNFAAGLQGFNAGLTGALSIAQFMDQRKQQAIENKRHEEQDAMAKQLNDWNMKVKQKQYEQFLNEEKLQEITRAGDALRLEMDDAAKTGTPVPGKRVAEYMNKIAPHLAQGSSPGTEDQSFYDAGFGPDGKSIWMEVKNNRTGEVKPVTQYRTNNPNDQVALVPLQDAMTIVGDSVERARLASTNPEARDQMLSDLRYTLTRAGYKGFLEDADREATARSEMAKEERKFSREKEIETLKGAQAKERIGLAGAQARRTAQERTELDVMKAGLEEEGKINRLAKRMEADPKYAGLSETERKLAASMELSGTQSQIVMPTAQERKNNQQANLGLKDVEKVEALFEKGVTYPYVPDFMTSGDSVIMRAAMIRAAQKLAYIQSGAAMGTQENEQYAKGYYPSFGDSEESIKDKLEALRRDLEGYVIGEQQGLSGAAPTGEWTELSGGVKGRVIE